MRIAWSFPISVSRKRRTFSSELEIRDNSKKIYCIDRPEEGSIIIKADTTKGIDFDHLGKLIVKLGEGVEFDENGCISATGAGNALTFTDINGNSIEYKPSADPKTITLGRGLQITDK